MGWLNRYDRKSAFPGAALCALVATLALPRLLLWQSDLTHSALTLGLFAALTLLGTRLFAEKEGRLRGFSLAFGFAFALCQLAGARLDAAGTVGGGFAPLGLIVASLALAPAAGGCFAAAARRWGSAGPAHAAPTQSLPANGPLAALTPAGDGALHEAPPSGGRRVFLLSFGLILLCWLPVYLAYFPGMFNYDSTGEAAQFTTGSYSGAFPAIHTLLLAAFYYLGMALGSPNAGIALYTAIQAAAVAASMAYALWYLWKLGRPRAGRLTALALFALLPFHPMMAMCTTKDLYFSAALLVLMVRLHMGWKTPALWNAKAQWAWVAGMTAAVGLFRHNGLAAIAAMLLAGLLALRKTGALRRFLCAALSGLVLYGAVSGGLNMILQPARTGLRESLSVPLSQTARVYALAQEQGEPLPESEDILAFIPDANRYQPHLADGVKRHATVGFSNLPDYLRLWAQVGAKHPAAYADAFLYLTKGYWHLDDLSHAEIYAERGAHGYLETANQDGFGVCRASLLPGLMALLDRLFVDNEYQRVPLLATLMEPAFWCWLLGAVWWMALYRRDRGLLFCSAMLLGLLVTMLLGPCAYMRYTYPLALCAVPLWGMREARHE